MLVAQVAPVGILVACAPFMAPWAQGAAPSTNRIAVTAGSGSTPAAQRPRAASREEWPGANGLRLREVTVTAERVSLLGSARTASEGLITNGKISLTPAFRSAQLLETVPGLTVTTHSGEGKANQYLMRGYNLDHGTDLALFIDDMPVNEPSHAHGQGYADINFMIPELVSDARYTKGPYYADEGDFASVGSVHIDYRDSIPTQISETVGTLNFQRSFLAGSTAVRSGTVLGAFEFQHYSGPWTPPGDQRKLNGAVRFSSGDAAQGFSVTAMFYRDLWDAQTDQPERALTERLIPSVYGVLDPSDAGYAQRASLSTRLHQAIGMGLWRANAYVISNRLYLWNNFTHFLIDPINGDQEQQHEDRETVGADSSYAWDSQLFGAGSAWESGVHARADLNDVSRVPTQDRIPLTSAQLAVVAYPSAYSERDVIHLGSAAAYIQITSHWTDRLRSVVGFRENYMYGTDGGTNAGTASAALAQPNASLMYRIGRTAELYASAGRGFHSDDLRGVNQARAEGIAGAPLIARQTGEEVGLRQDLLDRRVSTALVIYNLVARSETTYDPDVGQDNAGPGSHRSGYEINVAYHTLPWLDLYASYSGGRARYSSPFDDGTGHIGEYLPNAPFAIGSFNAYVRHLGAWSGGIAYRYLGAYPLTSGACSDQAVRADFPGLTTCAQAPTPKGELFGSGYGEWSAEVHYALRAGWSIALAGYNLLDKKANAMEYYYVDRLPAEGPDGIADLHFHPLEPISLRVTIAKRF